MYFMIALWGHERRVYAAIKFFIFTQASGLLMLIAILALYFIHGRATGTYTFDFTQLLGTEMAASTAFLLMLGFFAAFAVKLPAFPLHTWLPDAHTEAPTAGSVILAGVLIKIGAYGMIRFMVPLFPQAVYDFRTVGMILAVIGIIYGAVMAYAQSDMKRLVAYTSVSHMGFVLLGIFAWNTLALQGVVLQIVCHALSTGALFILVGGLQDRIHTRDMGKMGGLWAVAPRMGGTAMFFALASLGLPGLGNFVAEFLILVGAWQVSKWAAVLGAVGLVFATVYALWMMQRAFQGEETHGWKFPDLSRRELGMFGAMIAALVVLGFYPQPLITTARQTVTSVQQITAQSTLAPAAARSPGEPGGRGRPAETVADVARRGGREGRRPPHHLAADRAHRVAGGRHARRRVLALSRPRARADARRAGDDVRPAVRRRLAHRARRHAARHHGRLRALLHRPARGSDRDRRHPLVELPAASSRAPRGVLHAPAHRHARRRGARRQHPLRLLLPRPRDPQRLAVRAHRLSDLPGAVRGGGGQVPGARRLDLGLPRVRHGAGVRRDGDDVGRGRRRAGLAPASARSR